VDLTLADAEAFNLHVYLSEGFPRGDGEASK
jgi:hypothetical protein